VEGKMKIKQTTFYALRIIRRIHVEDRNIITSAVMAEKEEISQGVILKLLKQLERGNIVSAHQGRGEVAGGFSLNRGVDEITLLEVIDTMEKIDICFHMDKGFRESEKLSKGKCIEINEFIKQELSHHTVQELFELY